jgi:hypothetical protein
LNEISKPKYVGRFSKEQKAVLVKIMPLSLTEDMVKSGYISAEDGIDQILEKSNIPADRHQKAKAVMLDLLRNDSEVAIDALGGIQRAVSSTRVPVL